MTTNYLSTEGFQITVKLEEEMAPKHSNENLDRNWKGNKTHGNYVIRAQIQSTIDVTPIETEGSRMLVILRISNFSLQKIVS